MRRAQFLASAAALLFASSAAIAQAKPNFAGKWTILPDTTTQMQGISRGGGEMGGLGTEATISQTDKSVTVTRNGPLGEVTSVFNFDGSETYSSVTVQGQAIPLTLKARWDGNKLITSTWANVGQMIEVVLTFSLDAKGNLVTEHTFPAMGADQSGGTLVTKYKKSN
jgi:hypothetical protein